MKIFITGINGFIGQHLARELIKRGHIVSGLGREKKSTFVNKNYFSGSVLDKKLIEKAIIDSEIIVHLAALTAHKEIIDNKFETLETNFLGTKNVLDSFSKSSSTKKFLYSSTGKVYGSVKKLPIKESHPTHPLNILGKSKLITERLVDFYNNDKKEFIIFRIFNIYGPSQKENFLIPTIFKQLHKKEVTLGDVNAKRDYVFIDDLVQAFVLAIERKKKVGISIYNICSGIGVSALQIVKIVSEITGKVIKVKKNPKLFRNDEVEEEYGSYVLAQKELGWKPQFSLKIGLERMLH